MSFADKLRFVRLMVRSFRKRDWSDWHDRSAAELVDEWGGPGVRRAIFEPLGRLKFDLPCSDVSGAWLGARLSFREGSAPLGYIPGRNWTKVLCEGVSKLLEQVGVQVRLRSPVSKLHGAGDRIREVELEDGSRLQADWIVSTLPTTAYRLLVPEERTPYLDSIRYTAAVSAICVSTQSITPDFYWMNLASLDHNACGIFLLNSLNPTIGAPGEACVNFVTHLPSREHELFRRSDDQLLGAYLEDFKDIFGFDLEPRWSHVSRLPMYSPVFVKGFRNLPVRSTTWRNVYFAGNYRTFPSCATTGTALQSGIEAGEALLADNHGESDLAARVRNFRLRAMPRA
jgi:protoporphyrinogen oxidase